MENPQSLLSVALELTVTALVVTVVWTTVVAGLYQVGRDRMHRIRVAFQKPARERYAKRTATRPQVAHPQPTAGR